jgi:uncharacterized protein YdhG (YjbR/CyaY superfamily)
MLVKDSKVDAYIASFQEPVHTRLNELRAIIWHAAPEANEVFSNGMPGYVLHDSLVWFAAIEPNVAFYPRGHHFKIVYKAELVGYQTIAGAIVFPADTPLPAAFIEKIVRDRVHENRLTATPTPDGIPTKIGAPARRALAIAKITSLAALANYSEKEVLALHGIGPRALPILRAALQQAGLNFRRDE